MKEINHFASAMCLRAETGDKSESTCRFLNFLKAGEQNFMISGCLPLGAMLNPPFLIRLLPQSLA